MTLVRSHKVNQGMRILDHETNTQQDLVVRKIVWDEVNNAVAYVSIKGPEGERKAQIPMSYKRFRLSDGLSLNISPIADEDNRDVRQGVIDRSKLRFAYHGDRNQYQLFPLHVEEGQNILEVQKNIPLDCGVHIEGRGRKIDMYLRSINATPHNHTAQFEVRGFADIPLRLEFDKVDQEREMFPGLSAKFKRNILRETVPGSFCVYDGAQIRYTAHEEYTFQDLEHLRD